MSKQIVPLVLFFGPVLAIGGGSILAACSDDDPEPTRPTSSCRLPLPPRVLSCNDYRCVVCFDDLTCRRFEGHTCPELLP